MQFLSGNLLESGAEALVNTVNTVGVMGKGIALQFKEAYPDNFKQYEKAVKSGKVEVGKVFAVEINHSASSTRWILNFPTKKDYKHRSKLEYIRAGLVDLRRLIIELKIRSVALPPLGCGNGGLAWAEVKPLIQAALSDLPGTEIWVYEPSAEVYKTVARPISAKPINLTPTRTVILSSLDMYNVLGFHSTMIEIQKLVYFLQRLGEEFKGLNFVAGIYGPYASKLNNVLYDMEGYYLIGTKHKDAKPTDVIEIAEGKISDIQYAIQRLDSESLQRLERMKQVIDGFESPYGMELLSTVDWVLHNNPALRNESPTATVDAVHNWTTQREGLIVPVERKRQLNAEHIHTTREHLLGFADVLYS